LERSSQAHIEAGPNSAALASFLYSPFSVPAPCRHFFCLFSTCYETCLRTAECVREMAQL